ncbi:MAG: ankyrin repeat domain-containing protein, partial [Chloroflexota bacterium]
AVYYDMQPLVGFLLTQGANIQAPSAGRRGMTPLHVAAWRNNVPMARLLLENGANLQSRSSVDNLTVLETAQKVYSDGQLRTEMVTFLQEVS